MQTAETENISITKENFHNNKNYDLMKTFFVVDKFKIIIIFITEMLYIHIHNSFVDWPSYWHTYLKSRKKKNFSFS